MSTTQNASDTKNKRSASETGHAKNIANFQDLIFFCQGHGAIYNPSKESLRISEMQSQYQTSLDVHYVLKAKKVNFDNATNLRRIEFEFLKPLSTKILSAFTVSGADKLAIQDLKGINRKIQGPNYKKKNSKTTDETTTSISTSQQSYDRFIDHFSNILHILEKNPIYSPNEEELKLAALQARFSAMKAVNTSLIHAYTEYSNALIGRDKVLYNELTGMVQVSKEVKLYIKSIFGANSPQYDQIKSIEIRSLKK